MKPSVTLSLVCIFIFVIDAAESIQAQTNIFKAGPVTVRISNSEKKVDLPQMTLAAIGHSATNFGESARHVAVSGRFAYVANSSDGLRIFDVSDPTTPTFVGHPTNREYAQSIVVSANHAFLGTANGLRIYDVSNPAQPVAKNKNRLGKDICDLVVAEGFAYLADRDNGLLICDISNPSLPVVVGQTNNGGTAYGLALVEKRVYLAASNDGLRIYDVSDPTKPTNVGHIEGYVLRVAVTNQIAFLVGGGVQIYDVSNPANPIRLSQISGGGAAAVSVALSASYAFVANQFGCVLMHDISAPSRPVYVANTTTNSGPSPVVGLAVTKDKLYLANGRDGLRVYSLKDLPPVASEKENRP